MREKRAAGATRRMLDVQHLVEKDVLDGEMRDTRSIHPANEKIVIGARIVAAELAAPTAVAPTDVRTLQSPSEIFCVQLVEKLVQVEVAALRTSGPGTNTSPAHMVDARASSMRASVFEVRASQFGWRPA